jgi:hypothetical protein
MKTIIISAVLLMSVVCPGFAQEYNVKLDTLLWTVDQLVDKAANSASEFSCQFVTYPAGDVRWIQSDYTTNFSGSWESGSWTQLSQPGEIQTDVSVDGTSGYLKFSRNSVGLYVEMFFLENGENKMPFQFRVQNVMPYQP